MYTGLPNIINVTSVACLSDVMMSWDVLSDLTRVSYNLTLYFNGRIMVMKSTEDTHFFFEELAPGNNYAVSIQPTNDAGSGRRYNQSVTTAPNSKC